MRILTSSDKRYDFTLRASLDDPKDVCLAEWYGLDEYIVLSPSGNVGVTNNESKAKTLLSAATVVVNNTSIDIPIFVQVRDKWQKAYCGVSESNSIRTHFDIIHLKNAPYGSEYLSGLLHIFNRKIMSPYNIDNIIVSHKATYVLQHFGNFIWKQDFLTENIDVENMYILPFGVTNDPVESIYLETIYSHVSETRIADRAGFSDFIPMQAPIWHCFTTFVREPVCLLRECLSDFLEILVNNHTVYDFLGDYAVMPIPENNPLDVLTRDTVPTLGSLLSKAAGSSLISKNRRGTPPIHPNNLVPLLYFLFPDADENPTFAYGASDEKEAIPKKFKLFENAKEEFKGYKTTNEDSLVWRLSIVLAHALQSLGGLKAFCHIWYEFVQEMRYRWENGMIVPGVTHGMPDLKTCLLNQKLQMLNCCLERKINRDSGKYASAENSEESDEEFFDATENIEREKYSLWDRPVGRLSKFGDMKLLKTGDPLYIPYTQDPVLKTEDQLQEDTDILLKLGSDQEASELRARIMSASLLSDMESFKAANPGAVLEDFIRWYSPRDWLESEDLNEFGEKTGTLSPRMQVEGNIWAEMWENSRPVPAHRQKRLFDDTREAEKILQYLDFRTIGQIAELVVPVLTQSAIYRLLDELENLVSSVPDVETRLAGILKHGERISRDTPFQSKRFEVVVQEIGTLELQVSQINSLQYKFNPQGVDDDELARDVGDLALGKKIDLKERAESRIGSRIVSMFTDYQNLINDQQADLPEHQPPSIFPAPTRKEYVLRANCVRPGLCSTKSPQFMRSIWSNGEFRLIGAFSEDTSFF